MSKIEKPKLPLLYKEHDTPCGSIFVITDADCCDFSDEEFNYINKATEDHGCLTEENAKLREMLKMCADKLDKEVGFTGVANAAHFLLDELKDQNNDNMA